MIFPKKKSHYAQALARNLKARAKEKAPTGLLSKAKPPAFSFRAFLFIVPENSLFIFTRPKF